jgi:hypothetical protein
VHWSLHVVYMNLPVGCSRQSSDLSAIELELRGVAG